MALSAASPPTPDPAARAPERDALIRRIRMRMAELGIPSQRDLHLRSGIARRTLARLFDGRPSSTATLERLAEALDWTLGDLLQAPPATTVNGHQGVTEIAIAYARSTRKVLEHLAAVEAELHTIGQQIAEVAKADPPGSRAVNETALIRRIADRVLRILKQADAPARPKSRKRAAP